MAAATTAVAAATVAEATQEEQEELLLHLEDLTNEGIKVVTSKDSDQEFMSRCERWNMFSELEVKVQVVLVPLDTLEVQKIVNWLRKHNLTNKFGVRSGGHGFFSSASIVIDMRDGFSYCSCDSDSGIATIGMGLTLKEVDTKTHPYHMPLGVVSHTGCGLCLTGGVGYQTKLRGTSADNILEVSIVTSDGELHVCSKDNDDADLFWGVRGGAPNLGIVTEIKAQCYLQPDAFATLLAWPCTYENIQRLIDWADSPQVLNDPTMTPYIGMIPSPDLTTHLCCIHVVCIGSEDKDEKYSRLIKDLMIEDTIELLPPSRVSFEVPQTIFDSSFPRQYWYVSQNHFTNDTPLNKAGVKDVVDAFLKVKLNPIAPIVIYEQRGSIETSSFFHNNNNDDKSTSTTSSCQPRYDQRWECYVFFGTMDSKSASKMREEGRKIKSVIQKHASEGGRCHFTKDESGSRLELFYGSNTQRLKDVVKKYDSSKLFSKCNGMEF